MSMTRKHFVAIAETLKESQPSKGRATNYTQWLGAVEHFAAMCARQNPNFDRDRFLRACGYDN